MVERGGGAFVARGDDKIDHGHLDEWRGFARQGVEHAGANRREVDVSVERFERGEADVYTWVESESVEQSCEGAVVGFAVVECGNDALESVGGGLG